MPATPSKPVKQYTQDQIENLKYSIYIKDLQVKDSEETEQQIRSDLGEFGVITSLSVNAGRRSAIVRFK